MNVPKRSSDSVGEPRTFLAKGMIVVVVIALGKLLLHFVFNNRYGYFRDEFDYMACGNHLAWGYVDQPPLVPFLIKISRLLLGDSLRRDRKSTRLNSSHGYISYAVFCLKKKKTLQTVRRPLADIS